jgi:uncharacterized damage-inducible protein DinB
MEDLQYPIGPFKAQEAYQRQQRAELIDEIAVTPERLRQAIRGLSEQQLEIPYRPGGWTVRQVVHHIPESHMNSYIRFKLALTEEKPTIKPYDESAWAKLPDVTQTPIEVSLALLESLHSRWTVLLRSMSDNDFKRQFTHPDIGLMTLEKNLALYAWHGAHHVAHITKLRDRMEWNRGQ